MTWRNEVNKNAHGGSENMMEQLLEFLPDSYSDKFQIILSRVRELDEDKVRILYLHDLSNDP